MIGASAAKTNTPANTCTKPMSMKDNSFGTRSERTGSSDEGNPVHTNNATPLHPIVLRGASLNTGKIPSIFLRARRTGITQNKIGMMNKIVQHPKRTHIE